MEFGESSGFIMGWDAWELNNTNPTQIPISTSSDSHPIQIPISTSSNPVRILNFNVPRAHRSLYGRGGSRAPPDPHFVCLKLHKPGDYIEDHAASNAVDDWFPRCHVAKVSLLRLEQRFCQRCSCFDVESEFEEAKRSCKRRLAWHNDRRRKSPLESTTTNFSSPESNKMVTFGESFSYMYGNNNVHSSLSSNEADPWNITLEQATQSSTALRELIAETRARQLEASYGHYPGHVTMDLGFVPPGSRPSSASHVAKADEQ